MPLRLIQNSDDLAEAALRWRRRPWLAVDTEFVRVDTYYPKLCLIQVSDGEFSDCVDALAFGGPGATPGIGPLLEALYDTRVLKVFHAAGQDMEILLQAGGGCPAPLFDTQIAATLLGIGDQIGYASLIEKMIQVSVDKSLSRTDWGRRPLSTAELEYAAADVHHLAEVYPMLLERLEKAGRLGWLAQDCARLVDPAQYRADPGQAWTRLKGIGRLPPRAQQVAARLAAWREQEAQQRDRPRKWIVEDDALYRIAERQPQNHSQLEGLGVLAPRTLARHAETLLQVVQDALALEPVALATDDQLAPAQKALLQTLQERIRAIAQRLGVPTSYLAPRAELIDLVMRGPQSDALILRGWRREVAGEELLRPVS